MSAIQLSEFRAFEQTLKELEALATGSDRLTLRRGDILVRQGEPSDALYFVLTGRFTVHKEGTPNPIAEIGHGQPIGEIGFFAGLPRTATVIAHRDSSVLMITRERFQRIAESSPEILDAVILSLARRLSENNERNWKSPQAVRTLAIVPAGDSRPSQAFLGMLRDVFAATCRTAFFTAKDISEKFPAKPPDDPAISTWLNSLESDFDHIFYVGDPSLTDWTKKCARQADALLLVGTAGASVELNPSELFALSVHPHSTRRLIILHEARMPVTSGTSAWLEKRDVFMHHHVALEDEADVRRLFRFIRGQAVGFIAGGGGALGSAHLGAYKAFLEAGADFDILGGTSVGAAMTAGLAFGVDPERVDRGTHNIFVEGRAFRRFTLPRYGLIDHKNFDRTLLAEYGDTLIEDLWKPFFTVSSDISAHLPKIHRRGLVWEAVRASSSIPGILPPFFTAKGEMLVDGALMDNLPLSPMKALKTGPNVLVMIGFQRPTNYPVDYQSIPGLGELIATMLNPFSRRRLPQVPSILQVIMMSMLANQNQIPELGDSDILVKPELPEDIRFTSWERHNEIFLHAYRGVGSWIRSRIAEADPKMQMIMGAASPATPHGGDGRGETPTRER